MANQSRLRRGGEWPGSRRDTLHLGLTVELGDLEANLTALLGSQLNRSERCGERLSVERASLLPAPPSGLLKASFHHERWACAKVLGREVAKRLAGGRCARSAAETVRCNRRHFAYVRGAEDRRRRQPWRTPPSRIAGCFGEGEADGERSIHDSKSGQFQDDSAPCGRASSDHSQRAISRAGRSPSAFSGSRCANHARSMASPGEAA